MEVDIPNQSAWLINQAKSANSIYEARSWLITAKNAAPALFSVQFAAYELELKDKGFGLFSQFLEMDSLDLISANSSVL